MQGIREGDVIAEMPDLVTIVASFAIGRVRRKVTAAFGANVRYTPVDGQGTLVEAAPEVDAAQFIAIARAAIADEPLADHC